MKKRFLVIVLLLIVGLGVFSINKPCVIFAEQDTSMQYYFERNILKDNEVVSEVATNNETSKQNLEKNGYTLNKEDNIYKKTITGEELNNNMRTQNIYLEFENKINEIFKLQNEMFNKISEMFNGFSLYSTPNNNNFNKETGTNETIASEDNKENVEQSTEAENPQPETSNTEANTTTVIENKNNEISSNKEFFNENEDVKTKLQPQTQENNISTTTQN